MTVYNIGNCRTVPSPWEDVNAWRILEWFLTTDITYPETEDVFSSYLGDQYSPDDWKNARVALFSGDGDDVLVLSNLRTLMAVNIPQCLLDMASTAKDLPSRRPYNFKHFINDEAGDSEDDEDENEDEGEGEVGDGSSVLVAVIDNIFDKYERTPQSSSASERRAPYKAAWSSGTIESRMYLLVVHRTATHHIAEHLCNKGFPVTVSVWLPGQLYVSLCISEEEHEVVEHSNIKLPNSSWVRIKHGKYKGDIGYVFDPNQSNLFITVLIPLQEFPYNMPQGSVVLLDRSRLPNDNTVSDILDGDVVGYSYKGQQYYWGLLLLKNIHRHLVELVASPHADDI
ncbi:hypothetical protein C8R48DRAFT_772429 [Suillus tomentosus]|nr:hypothetical protein C8R48DRAFT_772429 [Suillus tomentosus]